MLDECQVLSSKVTDFLLNVFCAIGAYMCSSTDTPSLASRDNLMIIPLIAGTIAPTTAIDAVQLSQYHREDLCVALFTTATIFALLSDPLSKLPSIASWWKSPRFQALATLTCPIGRALEYFVDVLKDLNLGEELCESDLNNIDAMTQMSFIDKYSVTFSSLLHVFLLTYVLLA